MASSSFQANPSWHWPGDIHPTSAHDSSATSSPMPGSFEDTVPIQSPPTEESAPRAAPNPQAPPGPTPKASKHWPPRTCRICLETVNPTFHSPSDNLPGILQPSPNVTYESSDPESGRLLRPCKCKGSSKYVHEGCLQAWRHADPSYGKRNYWQCPTCGFRYRLERMQWGRWISSTVTQIALTITIFLTALFIMGFVADPIINLYADPYTIFWSPTKVSAKIGPILTDDDVPTWVEHFFKGLAATGLLGFVKVLFALGPWQYWNIRGSGIMNTGRSGNSGRDRMASISWIVIVIGVATFLAVGSVQRLQKSRKKRSTALKLTESAGRI